MALLVHIAQSESLMRCPQLAMVPLTVIESALVKRDLCERARAAASTAANSVQSAAMCARTALHSG